MIFADAMKCACDIHGDRLDKSGIPEIFHSLRHNALKVLKGVDQDAN